MLLLLVWRVRLGKACNTAELTYLSFSLLIRDHHTAAGIHIDVSSSIPERVYENLFPLKRDRGRMWAMRRALPILLSVWLMAMECMLKVHGYLERALGHERCTWMDNLKYEPAGYVVQLQFDNDCKVKEKYEFFDNTIAALLESNGIAPDEVVVQLEGPSIQAKVATLTSKDTCNEYAYICVPRWCIQIEDNRLHRNYMGSRDDLSKVAKIDDGNLVDEEIKDTLDSYMPNPCDSRTSGYWVRRRTGMCRGRFIGQFFLIA